jgi:uncharacterized protein with PIN domain
MDAVELRVAGELTHFTGGAHRIDVPPGPPRSVKDLVESVGVPHPEVALVLVDGASVDFGHRITGGEVVAVYPSSHAATAAVPSRVAPPRPAPRFVCDVHLGRLARRLRLLGFDTWYRTDADDDRLAALAADQDRILLSRDRGLLMRRLVVHGYCPRSDDADVQAVEVVRHFDLGGHVRPLTRCVRCNGRVRPVTKAEVLHRLPPRTRVEHDRFACCTGCGQVYWPGSHLPRIDAFLAMVNGGARTAAPDG